MTSPRDGRDRAARRDGAQWVDAPDAGLMRFLAGHLAVGTVAATVVTAGLIWSDTSGLGSLIARSDIGWMAAGLLWFGLWVTLGSVSMGTAVMGLKPRRDR